MFDPFILGGAAQGLLGSKRTSGRDAGNALDLNAQDLEKAKGSLADLLNYQGSADALDPLQSSRTATKEVQSNDILGQLFGPGGTLSRTTAEEQNLASRGYSLKPEDYEAYGQASDDIARMFGQSDQSLAQALESRGLGHSPAMAGQAFANAQGNKMEQLASIQRKIANDRMQSNMNRLAQTRSFLQGLGGQAENAIQDQYGRQLSSENARFGQQAAKTKQAQDWLNAMQNQGNEQMSQRMATEEQAPWARALSGGISGAQQGASFLASILGGGGGALSGGGAQAQQAPQGQQLPAKQSKGYSNYA